MGGLVSDGIFCIHHRRHSSHEPANSKSSVNSNEPDDDHDGNVKSQETMITPERR